MLSTPSLLLPLLVLATLIPSSSSASCVQISCPEGVERDSRANCVDVDPTTDSCLPTVENEKNCCPGVKAAQETRVTDNYTSVIAVNLVGAVPLVLVIGLTVWSLRSAAQMEEEERDQLEGQVVLFKEMEQESLRRSYRSSMFMHSTRRRTLGLRCSVSGPAGGYGRQMTLTITKRPSGNIGFATENLLVCGVVSDSPAEFAGVMKGMRIYKVNDTVVTEQSIAEAVRESPQTFQLTVIVREARESYDAGASRRPTLTMVTPMLTPATARGGGGGTRLVRIRLVRSDGPLGMQLTGLEVSHVKPGGVADQAGVQVGMQVHTINGKRVLQSNVTELVEEAGDSFLIDFVLETDNNFEPSLDASTNLQSPLQPLPPAAGE